MTQIYLVRHGSTGHNHGDPKKDRVKGIMDLPLDERGIAQAHQAGEFLKDKNITHTITSPLQRGMATAQIIAGHTGAQVASSAKLQPWDVGMYSGKPYYSVSHFLKWHQENPAHPTPGGESYQAFYDRFSKALPELLDFAQQQKGNVAAVIYSRHLLALDSVMNQAGPSGVKNVYGAKVPGSIHSLEVSK